MKPRQEPDTGVCPVGAVWEGQGGRTVLDDCRSVVGWWFCAGSADPCDVCFLCSSESRWW